MAVNSLITQLNGIAVYAKALETQAHIVHFNYVGDGNFLTVHRFLKEQYEAHLEQFDAAAEFVRALGEPFLGTVQEAQALPDGFLDLMPECGCDQMLKVYLKNLLGLIALAQQLEPVAQKARAIDVVDWAAQVVGGSSKAAWFLRATLGCR